VLFANHRNILWKKISTFKEKIIKVMKLLKIGSYDKFRKDQSIFLGEDLVKFIGPFCTNIT
jgi:hypothetical protein